MKKTFLLFALTFYCSVVLLKAQPFINSGDELVNGYSGKISGTDFDYHSFIPGLRQSIIIRAESAKDFMEWETDAPSLREKKKYAAFIWVTAIGSSPGNAPMYLTTDLNHRFSFNTDGRPAWTIDSDDGSSLSFNSLMTDQNGDHHGYMILRIPSGKLIKGKPLRIKVSGSTTHLTSWYMTYKQQVKTGVTLNPFPALIKKNNNLLQLVEAAIFYFGEETDLRETDGKEAHLSLKNGITGNQLNISGCDVTGKTIIDSDNTIKPLESKFFLIKTGF